MAYVQSKVMKKRLHEKRRVSGASLLRDELDNDSGGKTSLLDSLPAFQQNKGVMMANFEEWIKMATDNKINTTNSWNFALIDYFHDLNVLRESDNNINFQKASATLDGCVKIYSSRVDSVATETGRLLSGLAVRKQQEAEQKARNAENGEDDEDAEDGDSDAEVDEDGETTVKKARKNRAAKIKELGETLVSFETIRVKKLSQELSIDPLFKKTLAEFDEGGAKSLLLNTLHMDNHTRVVFDATTGESKDDQEQEDDNDEEQDESEIKNDDLDIEMSGIEEADVDIGDLKHLVYNEEEELDSLLVCPSFDHLGSVLKDVNKAKAILNDVNQQNISIHGDTSATNQSLDVEGAAANDDYEFDFGGNNFDDDDGGNSFGDLDQEAAAVLFQDGTPVPDDDEMQVVANVVDQDLMAYFDHTLKRNWAGPEHWKVKQLKKGKQELQPSTNKGADKIRKPKEELVINFMEEFEDDEEERIFAKSKNPTTIPLDQQEAPDSHLLPDDVYFSSEQLVRLFLKPHQKLRVFQRKSKQVKFEQADETRQEDNRQVDATFWADNYKENNNQEEPADDYGGGGGGADFDFGGDDDFDDGDNIFNTDNVEDKIEFGTQLITGGKKVKSEYVNYSKTAKNVNVKYLKDNLWDAIEVKKEQPERNFSEVVQDIGKLYPKEEKKDLSTSFFFICLLHLANEHSLDLESNEQLTDLQIKGLIA